MRSEPESAKPKTKDVAKNAKRSSSWTFDWLRPNRITFWLIVSSLVCLLLAVWLAIVAPYPRIDQYGISHPTWLTRTEVNADLRIVRLNEVADIEFVSTDDWWAITETAVLRTLDGGRNWQVVALPLSELIGKAPLATPKEEPVDPVPFQAAPAPPAPPPPKLEPAADSSPIRSAVQYVARTESPQPPPAPAADSVDSPQAQNLQPPAPIPFPPGLLMLSSIAITSESGWLASDRGLFKFPLSDPTRVRLISGGIPPETLCYFISCVDEAVGWLSSSAGIWYTEDGGESWKKVSSDQMSGDSVLSFGRTECYVESFEKNEPSKGEPLDFSQKSQDRVIYRLKPSGEAKLLKRGVRPVFSKSPNLPFFWSDDSNLFKLADDGESSEPCSLSGEGADSRRLASTFIISQFRGSLFAGTSTGEIWQSKDTGKTWSLFNKISDSHDAVVIASHDNNALTCGLSRRGHALESVGLIGLNSTAPSWTTITRCINHYSCISPMSDHELLLLGSSGTSAIDLLNEANGLRCALDTKLEAIKRFKSGTHYEWAVSNEQLVPHDLTVPVDDVVESIIRHSDQETYVLTTEHIWKVVDPQKRQIKPIVVDSVSSSDKYRAFAVLPDRFKSDEKQFIVVGEKGLEVPQFPVQV